MAGLEIYKNRFFENVDIAPLALFRVAFGFLLAAEGFGAILTGWVARAYIIPKHTFVFIPFDFLSPLPGNGMYYYFFIMGLFGLMIMLGWKYRIAAIGYFLLWSGAYLMQKTNYNNHYYLMVLLTFILIFLPANRSFSLDAKYNPKIRSNVCIRGIIWVFILQSAIFYMYASVAKWNTDWVGYNSVEQLFLSKYDYPGLGPLLSQHWFQIIISWGGIVFDFFVVPALLWRKTRKYAVFAAFFFHLFNSVVFQIGVFPYMALALLLFFYNGRELRTFLNRKRNIYPKYEKSNDVQISTSNQKMILIAFTVWFAIQLILPIRHHFIEGDVNWTEEGHRMSWRMMLRTKQGRMHINVIDNETGQRKVVHALDYLTPKQYVRVATHPDMMWQFVQILKKEYAGQDISIFIRGWVTLNGGKAYPLFKSDYDMAHVDWDHFRHAEWIWPYPGANIEDMRSAK